MADGDKVPAELTEIREAITDARARIDPEGADLAPDDVTWVVATGAPRLLAAVAAAMEFHQPLPLFGDLDSDGDQPCAHCAHDPEADCHFEAPDDAGRWLCGCRLERTVCEACSSEPDGEYQDWPCPEYQAIATALTGEES
jgi:hypothetical protein